jgi:hypothetical protein
MESKNGLLTVRNFVISYTHTPYRGLPTTECGERKRVGVPCEKDVSSFCQIFAKSNYVIPIKRLFCKDMKGLLKKVFAKTIRYYRRT